MLVPAVPGIDDVRVDDARQRYAAPRRPWRITTISTFIASMLRAVSLRVSPLDTLLPAEAKLITSAESRLSASSNESRVRVEFSKNTLAIVIP